MGPTQRANVLAMFTIPITLVRSWGGMIDVRRICRGTTSMVRVAKNKTKRVQATGTSDVKPIPRKNTADGAWVANMALTGPKVRAKIADGILENESI